jgi:spermidine synthase
VQILWEFHPRNLGLISRMRINLPPFLLGFLALSFQIYLIREFSVHFYGNEIMFGFILASWLLWGGLGSLFASRITLDISRIPYMYYLVIFLFPLCLVLLRFSRFFLNTLPGEITGMTPMLFFSLGLSLIISFPLGVLFVFNALFLKGNVTQVYLMESLGSAVAGLAVYFFFIPLFSNWQATAVIGVIVSSMVFLFFYKRIQILFFALLMLLLAVFWVFDLPSQKIHWKPFEMIESVDTPFGKLQVIQTEELFSLYNNSLLVFSYPNPALSEESVHFALLQRPQSEKVLLIGGAAGGSLGQVLKYPKTRVDYVELNPEIIRLSLKYLPQQELDNLENPRVHIYFQDGRAFLEKTPDSYDAIILNLPDPSTAQINRFYTKEFFSLVKRKLSPDGIFSFRVSSAENYISNELRNFLGSLYFTLKEVFPEIEIVPGDSNIFLASSAPISLDYQTLGRKIDRLGLDNTYIRSQSLFSRLSPLRLSLLKDTIVQGQKSINLDLIPISYYYNSVLWNSQFQGLESSLYRLTSRLGKFWLLDVPLIMLSLILVYLGWRHKKSSFFLLPLAVMGLTTITVEIIMLIAFQTLYGYLYQKVALLFASFMVGLFLGAFRGKNRNKKGYLELLVIQFGFILLIFLLILWLGSQPPEIFFFLYLIFLGYLGGDLFIVSNQLYLKEKKNLGAGYGLDLLGSFFGALAVSSLLIPLFGLPLLTKYILLLNSFCLLFLLWGRKFV